MKQKGYQINKSVSAMLEVVCPKSSNYRKGMKSNQVTTPIYSTMYCREMLQTSTMDFSQSGDSVSRYFFTTHFSYVTTPAARISTIAAEAGGGAMTGSTCSGRGR
jgi:hypothetical protein